MPALGFALVQNCHNLAVCGVLCHTVTYIVNTVYITSYLIQIQWYIFYHYVNPRLAVLFCHTAKFRLFSNQGVDWEAWDVQYFASDSENLEVKMVSCVDEIIDSRVGGS